MHRMVEKNKLRESNKENGDVLKMFGDDPEPMVMTERVGFGLVSNAHARGLCTVEKD